MYLYRPECTVLVLLLNGDECTQMFTYTTLPFHDSGDQEFAESRSSFARSGRKATPSPHRERPSSRGQPLTDADSRTETVRQISQSSARPSGACLW